MARTCSLCHKSYSPVWRLKKLRGKYNPSVKKRRKPNLQWVTLSSGKRIIACTKCIKTVGKKKQPRAMG